MADGAQPNSTTRWVYSFGGGAADGDAKMKNLLGGKGANLAEMSALGLPVPPGFTITTEACVHYYQEGQSYPAGLEAEVAAGLKKVEALTGKSFGDAANPLLVSVRSGARASMPGMMDTVLNLGLNDETVAGLAKLSGDRRFAFDSYRRFIQMYSNVVLGLEHHAFEEILDDHKDRLDVTVDTDLTAENWEEVVRDYKAAVKARAWQGIPPGPQGPAVGRGGRRLRQLDERPGQVLSPHARHPRKLGHGGERAVDGVRQHGRDLRHRGRLHPQSVYGRQPALRRVPDQRPGRGRGGRHPHPPEPHQGRPRGDGREGPLHGRGDAGGVRPVQGSVVERLEHHYRDMQDIEFTVEQGQLYMLQTRSGKRTAKAALKVAVDQVAEGLISENEAVMRVEPSSLDQLLHPTIDPAAKRDVIAQGLPASPGAATGEIVFDADEAERLGSLGKAVILVRDETSPEDIHGMHAATGVVTARGGMTSHAAVVARGMGRPCVSGAGELHIDAKGGVLSARGRTFKAGDVITIDGSKGEILAGAMAMVEPELSGDFASLMIWADKARRLKVRANAETPLDAKTARGFGAEGIGLCRTEHMFFDETRIAAVREMILADDEAGRRAALAKILPFQRSDFKELFEIMAGLPVTIRLLDPPLHEFLPHSDAECDALAASAGLDAAKLKRRTAELQETNPMLGWRGCRLGVAFPEIYEMQVQAIFEAACEIAKTTEAPIVEVMHPLVAKGEEMKFLRQLTDRVAKKVLAEQSVEVPYKVGAMIELPRAALRANELAETAEFFSFGTNDLTQTTFGISRDDSGRFLDAYIAKGIFEKDPFVSIDQDGVGDLMKIGVERGRTARPDVKLGICGEHGGDPASITFCEQIGLDYVSCSPYRVPIARLAAAQAALAAKS